MIMRAPARRLRGGFAALALLVDDVIGGMFVIGVNEAPVVIGRSPVADARAFEGERRVRSPLPACAADRPIQGGALLKLRHAAAFRMNR